MRHLQFRLSGRQVLIALQALLIASAAFAGAVQAGSWSALGSGYAITTDWQGVDVPVGTVVTATAGTTDESVGQHGYAVFLWHYELNASIMFASENSTLWSNGTTYYHNDKKTSLTVYFSADTRTLTDEGEWGVQALFYDVHGKLRGDSGIIKIKATSVTVIPEVMSTLIVALVGSALLTAAINGHARLERKKM